MLTRPYSDADFATPQFEQQSWRQVVSPQRQVCMRSSVNYCWQGECTKPCCTTAQPSALGCRSVVWCCSHVMLYWRCVARSKQEAGCALQPRVMLCPSSLSRLAAQSTSHGQCRRYWGYSPPQAACSGHPGGQMLLQWLHPQLPSLLIGIKRLRKVVNATHVCVPTH